jgi:hypothetical protein
LGYYWEHVFLKAKSGPNLGGIINPDTGAAILDSERQKLTHLDFVDKIKLFESLTLPHEGTTRYSALWQADRERIQRMAPIEYIGRYMGGWFDFAVADELHQLAGLSAGPNNGEERGHLELQALQRKCSRVTVSASSSALFAACTAC